jgi:hypothetical protein
VGIAGVLIMVENENEIDIQKIEVLFEQPDAPGWIYIFIKAGKIKHKVWASYVFPPFENLVKFLQDIILNNLPSYLDIDEEGSFECFKAMPHENKNLFHFTLHHPCNRESCVHIPIDGIFERNQFCAEFLEKFQRFLETGYDDALWADGDLTSIDLDTLKKNVE